ncbi:Cysteine--tRNA ligase [Yokenella regensburgei]|nr:Cysteine--tRNA ligase [Yokenella regensburgei]
MLGLSACTCVELPFTICVISAMAVPSWRLTWSRATCVFLGYKLKYVRNITDIDDKIIKRANENGEDFVGLVDRMIIEMHKDFDALNILRPDSEPRATHHIPEIIEITERLIERGHAYVADNGDVMFSVPSDPTYGELSRQDLDQLQAGARVDVVDVKRNPMDFVLWKMSKAGEQHGLHRGAKVVLAGTSSVPQ